MLKNLSSVGTSLKSLTLCTNSLFGCKIHCSKMATRKLPCCANLPFLFPEEGDLLSRFNAASKCGFKAVEFPFPEELNAADVAHSMKKNNLTVVMMNSSKSGSINGFAAIPGMEAQFLTSLSKSVEFCKALNCSKLHVVAGVVEKPSVDHDQTYEKNIRMAVDICEKKGITVLIEPISPTALPNYYLNNFDRAVALIKKINNPFLKLQVDFFHLQIMKGNLANNIKDWFPLIGHIQVAQVPNRNEPDTPGEINFQYIFDLLSELKYKEWIGFEYKPATAGNVAAGLGFLDKMDLTI